ncbi:MAG: hypothetical protein QG597_4517, partial [Actinomycetota bacterium]|nr:hypothetical protein [Actinomycetota bacterium]
LRAVNAAGPGPASAAVPVTPIEPGPIGNVFVPISPSRVIDTRTAKGGTGAIQTGTQRVFSIATVQDGGAAAVPAGATAIVYNLTVPNPAIAGHLRVMPGDAASLTTASAINFRPGETIANGLTTTVDAQRRIVIYAGSTADAIVDVVGYYLPSQQAKDPQAPGAVTPAATGSRFTPTEPQRVYSTITDPAGALPAGVNRQVSVAAAVPAGAIAVAYNITVVRPASDGHLRVMPGDVMTTPTSTINWTATGDTIANGLTVALGGDRTVRVQNFTSGDVHFLFDVVGYYSASGALFYPTDPTRVFESRTSHGGTGPILPLLPGQRVVSVAQAVDGGAEQVPEGAIAIAYNVAVTNTGSSGHLRVYPGDLATLASASTLNWPGAGFTRANGTAVGISALREVKVYNGSDTSTDVFIDTYGYFR